MLGNNNVKFKEDQMEELYQEGAAARAAGESKCPYAGDAFKEHYWRRGFTDAASPPAEGTWLPYAKYTPREDTFLPGQMKPELFVLLPDGTPLIRLFVNTVCRMSTDEVNAFGYHLERLLTDHPFEMDARVIEKDPNKLRREQTASSGGGSSRRSGRIVDGKVKIPEGAKIGEDGEIIVPPRSLDGSSPTAKSFRRACRAARNAIRELSDREKRSTTELTLEMMEGS